MTTRLDSTASTNPEETDDSEDIARRYAECPGCANRVLLFSQTIQTFCFQCGTPVAVLDERKMYYLPVKPLTMPD